eukprot:scaffold90602_cov52-Phaeocystis_antarctica.AAC.1
MVKVPPWQRPSSAPAPPQGAPGVSGQPGTPRKRPRPLGTQPLPRVIEPAASKAADFTGFDRLGATRSARARPTATRTSPSSRSRWT